MPHKDYAIDSMEWQVNFCSISLGNPLSLELIYQTILSSRLIWYDISVKKHISPFFQLVHLYLFDMYALNCCLHDRTE